jgi:very-short-patch-repair endonuclease
MRHEPSRGEWLLWQVLCRSQQGVAFRRQVVLQGYVADFYACAVRLIVEVDGAWHYGRARSDARRDRVLAAAGYRVLRVAEQEVISALPTVVARIRAAVAGC